MEWDRPVGQDGGSGQEDGGSGQEDGEGILLNGLRGFLAYLNANLVPGQISEIYVCGTQVAFPAAMVVCYMTFRSILAYLQ